MSELAAGLVNADDKAVRGDKTTGNESARTRAAGNGMTRDGTAGGALAVAAGDLAVAAGDPAAAAGDPAVAAVRAFNRFYTNMIGLLRGKYLDTPYSLTEARILFELAQRDASEVTDLRRAVDIDAG